MLLLLEHTNVQFVTNNAITAKHALSVPLHSFKIRLMARGILIKSAHVLETYVGKGVLLLEVLH